MKKNKLGGEFEINPNCLLTDFVKDNSEQLYANGRIALLAILKAISITHCSVIYLPEYLCLSVFAVCKSLGLKIETYELDEGFLFPEDFITHMEDQSILLTVNYFGFVKDQELVKKVRKYRPDVITISDQVQSIWTLEKTVSHFAFTSFRKHFPTPDGAKVFNNTKDYHLPDSGDENTFYFPKLIGSIIKYTSSSDESYLSFFEKGEHMIDEMMSVSSISGLGYSIYKQLDLSEIAIRRRENYELIYDIGRENGLSFLFPYDSEIVPLCVPILLQERNRVRKALMRDKVFLPVHWPLHQFNDSSEQAQYFASRELSLLIDQRYSSDDIKFQMKSLIKEINS